MQDIKYEQAIKALRSRPYGYMNEAGEIEIPDCFDIVAFDYKCGVSKVCIILEDVVLKTPLYRIYEDNDAYANVYNENTVNYAALEAAIYQRATDEEVGKFFASTFEVETNIYEQEKADCLVPVKYHLYRKEEEVVEFEKEHGLAYDFFSSMGLKKLYAECPKIIMILLFQQNEISQLLKLQSFLEKYQINDLHCGNWGFFDGKIKLIDYCGFDTDTNKILGV